MFRTSQVGKVIVHHESVFHIDVDVLVDECKVHRMGGVRRERVTVLDGNRCG